MIFLCRLLTNNVLLPIIDLVDAHNVNYGLVAAFQYLTETINKDLSKDSNQANDLKRQHSDSIGSDSLDDFNQLIAEIADEFDAQNEQNRHDDVSLNPPLPLNQNVTSTSSSITPPPPNPIDEPLPDQSIDDEEKSETLNSMMKTTKKPSTPIRKRKRRSSVDESIWEHHKTSFKVSHFFIEINGNQSESYHLRAMQQCSGYSVTATHVIDAANKFKIRFVSKQCVSLCARWVTLMDDRQILGDSSSLRHLTRIEYDRCNFIYIWDDHKCHDFGDQYLQLGVQVIVSTDVQRANKYYNIRHVFIPLRLPLLHIYVESPIQSITSSLRVPTADSETSDGVLTRHTSTSSISDGIISVFDGIGDGIKKLIPVHHTKSSKTSKLQKLQKSQKSQKSQKQSMDSVSAANESGHSLHASPGSLSRRSSIDVGSKEKRRNIFKIKSKDSHSFHHEMDDIGFLVSNKEKKSKSKSKSEDHRKEQHRRQSMGKSDEAKLRLLAAHRPTTNLTIRIWDVYRDFDQKMSPYVAYVLRIRDDVAIGDGKTKRMEWTIKTRFSKLHSFHRAINKEKSLKSQNIRTVAQFPGKSLITKMDAKYIAERKKQLIAYFNTLHHFPDVLRSDAVYQLVIPPVLVETYGDHGVQSLESTKEETLSPPSTQEGGGTHGIFADSIAHPALPSQAITKEGSDEAADQDTSWPVIFGGDMAFVDEEEDEMDTETRPFTDRPRRGSFPGCHDPRRVATPPPMNGDLAQSTTLKVPATSEQKENGRKEQSDVGPVSGTNAEVVVEKEEVHIPNESKPEIVTEKKEDAPSRASSERFRIEQYEHITPSFIRLLEAFLELEKRNSFSGGLAAAATTMMSWFFNGYIAKTLYSQTAQNMTYDGTLSYLMQWVSDLLWIPPTYQMKEQPDPPPTTEEMESLRVQARECIVKLFEVYVGDTVPTIIGSKRQLERCVIKFWRFLQQNKLLRHLAFTLIDALLQDLFPERISRRYKRRVWIAERQRRRELEAKEREKKRAKKSKKTTKSQDDETLSAVIMEKHFESKPQKSEKKGIALMNGFGV